MLVLTRKSKQKITIGKEDKQIVITVLKIKGDKVSIGIEADEAEFPVYRYELIASEKMTRPGLESGDY